MCNIVVALAMLSATHDELNTAQLAWACSHHLSSADMAYAALLADTGILPSHTAATMNANHSPTQCETLACAITSYQPLARPSHIPPPLMEMRLCHVATSPAGATFHHMRDVIPDSSRLPFICQPLSNSPSISRYPHVTISKLLG